MTYFFFLILLTPPVLYAWAQANPHTARALVAELKRRWRLSVIRRHGNIRARRLFTDLFALAASQGFDQDLVQEFVAEHFDEVSERLGAKAADEFLGEPTPLERFF